MSTNRATYTLNESAPEALVIYCSDPRFQAAYQQFLQEELHLTHYMPLVIPGSVSSVGIQDMQPKHFKALYQQLKFLANLREVPRAIIINHDDCRWYDSVKSFFQHRRVTVTEQQKKDLLATAGLIKEFLPESHVELYQARITDDKQITFEKII